MEHERFVAVEDIIQALHLDGIEPTARNIKEYLEPIVGHTIEIGMIDVYLEAYAEEPDTAIDMATL